MPGRGRWAWLRICVAVGLTGCGGADSIPAPTTNGPAPAPVQGPNSSASVTFVGFDGSPPLVTALKQGKLKGLVLQNPLRMGELGVKTLVRHLEGQTVDKTISTGEVLATPENMTSAEVNVLLNPPKESHGSGNSLQGAKAKKWRIIVIPKGTTHEFWKTIHAGAVKAANELGNVEVVWQGPQKEDDRTDQIKLVQNAVAAGVDGIVLAPLDAKALVAPVEQAIARKIPVVIIDSGLESTQPVSYVATNNYNGGVLGARRLGELLGGKGRIILVRYMIGSASTQEREQGFLDTMAKEFPGITYVSNDQYSGATSDTAQRLAETLVTRYRGQFDGIFCPNESSTLGVLRALEKAGLLAGSP